MIEDSEVPTRRISLGRGYFRDEWFYNEGWHAIPPENHDPEPDVTGSYTLGDIARVVGIVLGIIAVSVILVHYYR